MNAFNTKLIRPTVALVIAASLLSSCYEFGYLYEDLPFEMAKVHRPQIPAREVNIADFGGVGDGVTLNSQAFADAIEASRRCRPLRHALRTIRTAGFLCRSPKSSKAAA